MGACYKGMISDGTGGGGGRPIKAGYMMEHLNPGEIEHIMPSSTLLCQSS